MSFRSRGQRTLSPRFGQDELSGVASLASCLIAPPRARDRFPFFFSLALALPFFCKLKLRTRHCSVLSFSCFVSCSSAAASERYRVPKLPIFSELWQHPANEKVQVIPVQFSLFLIIRLPFLQSLRFLGTRVRRSSNTPHTFLSLFLVRSGFPQPLHGAGTTLPPCRFLVPETMLLNKARYLMRETEKLVKQRSWE